REIVVGGEEQLGDREASTGRRLGGQYPRVKIKILALRMRIRERRHADAEVAQLAHHRDQFGRVVKSLWMRFPGHGRTTRHIAADREDMMDTRRRVGTDHPPQLL